jgi:predicted transposase YbfD/YdcC
MEGESMESRFACKFNKHFENVTDPRINRGKNYPLTEMIFVALYATICDCNTWTDVADFGRVKLHWFRKFMPFEQGIPSHDTFSKVFARLNTQEFYAALVSLTLEIARAVNGQHPLQGETVAFDGKTLRGSHDKSCDKSALHSVSAWACNLRMCIAIKSVDDKSNEIPAVQALIDMLDLEGAVVTADAMNCQRETAAKVIEKQGDYLLIAKGNQDTLQAEIMTTLIQAQDTNASRVRRCTNRERNRERLETREITAFPVPKDSPVFARWPGLATIGSIYRTREIAGRVEESIEFFISSLPCKAGAIAKHRRAHWGIENSEHHVLDVTFTEDASRIRKGTGPEITSVFRRLALNILQRDTSLKGSIRSKRKQCGWSESIFERLITGFCEN